MSLLESDDGWLGLEWSEDSTGLDIQDSSFHHMSGASTDMTEIPEDLLAFGFSMLLASTVSTCLLRLLKLPMWLLIFTKVSFPRDQTRSFQASSDLPSKVTQCLFWNILLLTQGQHSFSREGDCTKLWVLGICEHLCVFVHTMSYMDAMQYYLQLSFWTCRFVFHVNKCVHDTAFWDNIPYLFISWSSRFIFILSEHIILSTMLSKWTLLRLCMTKNIFILHSLFSFWNFLPSIFCVWCCY